MLVCKKRDLFFGSKKENTNEAECDRIHVCLQCVRVCVLTHSSEIFLAPHIRKSAWFPSKAFRKIWSPLDAFLLWHFFLCSALFLSSAIQIYQFYSTRFQYFSTYCRVGRVPRLFSVKLTGRPVQPEKSRKQNRKILLSTRKIVLNI